MEDVDTDHRGAGAGASDPELEAARDRERERERRAHHAMAMQLVRQYPDPALRVPARAIADVDDEVRGLVERMADVMRRSHGVGLAAPQIGVLQRVFVYRSGADDARARADQPGAGRDVRGDGGRYRGLPLAPRRRGRPSRSSGTCASSPAASTSSGEPVEVEAEGLEARVIQHELDHLDGVLIIDRAPKEDRRAALKELRLKA